MRYRLYHTPEWRPTALLDALAAEDVAVEILADPSRPPSTGLPTVVVLGPETLPTMSAADFEGLWRTGAVPVGIGDAWAPDIPEGVAGERLSAFLPSHAGPRRFLVAFRTALRESAARLHAARAAAHLAARSGELAELTAIGIQLTTEKDYRALLDKILANARRVTRADAGSLYLVEPDGRGRHRLRFCLTQNDSRPTVEFQERTMAIDHESMAGHVAATGTALVIEDVHDLPPDTPYHFNPAFDNQLSYRTRSMLVLPMPNHRGEIRGVLQLINRKRTAGVPLPSPDAVAREVVPFDGHAVELATALASLAAVALENSQLYEEIERLFDGFVRAAVTAIEQRDPVTSGHSERVADMTVRLAQAVDRSELPPFHAVRFSPAQLRELRYASLLHDFGKVAVREKVLAKEKKLYDSDLALIRERHAFLVRTAQWQFEKARATHLERHGTRGYAELLEALAAAQQQELAHLDQFLAIVVAANEPSVLPTAAEAGLAGFAEETYRSLDGATRPLLSEDEFRLLRIPQGTLDDQERRHLEDHVRHTYAFLQRIPWTEHLRAVPDIAYGHHEKMDGGGYPQGLRGAEILLPTRLMTVADIFDALTAQDRPYKPALPASRALALLEEEARAGAVDPHVLTLFVEAEVYRGMAAE